MVNAALRNNRTAKSKVVAQDNPVATGSSEYPASEKRVKASVKGRTASDSDREITLSLADALEAILRDEIR